MCYYIGNFFVWSFSALQEFELVKIRLVGYPFLLLIRYLCLLKGNELGNFFIGKFCSLKVKIQLDSYPSIPSGGFLGLWWRIL